MAFMPLDLDMFLAEMKHDVAEIVYDDYGTVRVFRGTLMGRLLPAPPVTPQGLEEHILIQRTRWTRRWFYGTWRRVTGENSPLIELLWYKLPRVIDE